MVIDLLVGNMYFFYTFYINLYTKESTLEARRVNCTLISSMDFCWGQGGFHGSLSEGETNTISIHALVY